jgi:hypothetical protein
MGGAWSAGAIKRRSQTNADHSSPRVTDMHDGTFRPEVVLPDNIHMFAPLPDADAAWERMALRHSFARCVSPLNPASTYWPKPGLIKFRIPPLGAEADFGCELAAFLFWPAE